MANIRPAAAGDIDDLVVLLHTLFSIEKDFQSDSKRQRQGLEMMLANPQGCILVAESDKKVVGMCSGQILVSTAEGGPVLLLEDVIVADEYQRQGVGKLLIKGMTDWAQPRNVSRLNLLADKNNTNALNFYKHIGWQKTQLICLRKYIV